MQGFPGRAFSTGVVVLWQPICRQFDFQTPVESKPRGLIDWQVADWQVASSRFTEGPIHTPRAHTLGTNTMLSHP